MIIDAVNYGDVVEAVREIPSRTSFVLITMRILDTMHIWPLMVAESSLTHVESAADDLAITTAAAFAIRGADLELRVYQQNLKHMDAEVALDLCSTKGGLAWKDLCSTKGDLTWKDLRSLMLTKVPNGQMATKALKEHIAAGLSVNSRMLVDRYQIETLTTTLEHTMELNVQRTVKGGAQSLLESQVAYIAYHQQNHSQ